MRIGQSRSCTFLYKVDNANPSLGKEVSISCLNSYKYFLPRRGKR